MFCAHHGCTCTAPAYYFMLTGDGQRRGICFECFSGLCPDGVQAVRVERRREAAPRAVASPLVNVRGARRREVRRAVGRSTHD